MNEQAKFQAWWDECGFNSVILRAAAWEAWMARAEQWPKYWTTFDPDTFAFVKQISKHKSQCIFKDGKHGPVVEFFGSTERRQITEAEAMALLKKPEPQPAKTRVRLWMRCDGGFGSAVVASTFEKSGDWQEIHHDAEGFYVEEANG